MLSKVQTDVLHASAPHKCTLISITCKTSLGTALFGWNRGAYVSSNDVHTGPPSVVPLQLSTLSLL